MTITASEFKAKCLALLERVRKTRKPLRITRRGKPVAQIIAAETKRKPIDVEALRAITDKMRQQDESAGDFMRRLRDDYRY